jgi:hypothetical protein
MILKYFRPKNWRKFCNFSLKLLLFGQKKFDHIVWFVRKTPFFAQRIGKNPQKYVVIITLAQAIFSEL